MRNFFLPLVLSVLALIIATSYPARAESYYVSNMGDDSATGTTPSLPWKTIAKVNVKTFKPGDTINFRRGDVWREQLIVSGVGDTGNPITYSAYQDPGIPDKTANPVITPTDLFDGWLAYSHLSNAGFEWMGTSANPIPNWLLGTVNQQLFGSFIAKVSDVANQGKYAVHLYLNSLTDKYAVYLAQIVTTIQPDQDYLFSFSSKSTNGMRLRVRAKMVDGSYWYLYRRQDGSYQWTPTWTGDTLFTADANWTNHSVPFHSMLGSTEIKVYFFNNEVAQSSIWIDNTFLNLAQPNRPKIWEGHIDGVKQTFGALSGVGSSGQRIPTPNPYPRLNPRTLNNGQFHAPLYIDIDNVFYYRNDAGIPPPMDIGVRRHAILIQDASNIVIQNIDIYGPTGINDSKLVNSWDAKKYNPILVSNSHDVILSGVTISHSNSIGMMTTDGSYNCSYRNIQVFDHASTCMYFWNAGAGSSVFGTKPLGCQVYSCGLLPTDSGDMGIIGVFNTTGIRIEGCSIHDNGHKGLPTLDAGVSIVDSPYATVTRNIMNNIGGVAIQFAENSDHSEASYNVVDGWGLYGTSGSTGPYDQINPAPYAEGIRLGGGVGTVGCQGCKVYNNLLINGGKTTGNWGAIAFVGGKDYSGTAIRNNIFYNNAGIYEIKVEPGAGMTNVSFSNNVFYRTAGNAISWQGKIYYYNHIIGNSLGYYSFDWGQERGSLATDPLLVDPYPASGPPDYHLTANSPPINAGINVGLGQDIDGNKVTGNPDIGPHEYRRQSRLPRLH